MSNTRNKPTPHPHAELIKAWANGAKIQLKVRDAEKWIDTDFPAWTQCHEYRVKPEEHSNEPWKPKKGEKYYYLMISYDGFELYSTTCGEYIGDNIGIDEMGNCFRTEEEAKAAVERVKAALKGELKISAPNDEKIQLDGKPLTDGEKELIKALRNIKIERVPDYSTVTLCYPSSDGTRCCGTNFAVAFFTSNLSSEDDERSVIAALKQIQAEQEETDE